MLFGAAMCWPPRSLFAFAKNTAHKRSCKAVVVQAANRDDSCVLAKRARRVLRPLSPFAEANGRFRGAKDHDPTRPPRAMKNPGYNSRPSFAFSPLRLLK
jgi:hypothetical protein